MEKKKIINMVDSELKHIPRGLKGSPQNMLRMYYYNLRENDLAHKNPRGPNAILSEGISYIKKENPDFKPTYDDNFSI